MPLHGLQTIYEAFVLLAKERNDFELHLCFWGDIRRKEFEAGKDLGAMPWLVIHDDLIAADGSLPRFINEKVHIGFSHYGTGPTAEYVYTNKVLECMALGRTALVADLPGNHEYGDIEKLFFVSPPTVDGLLEAARIVLDQPETRKAKEALCIEEFHRHYSEAAAKRRFQEILETFHDSWKATGGKR
jgi:glycosyltransferase involved in cell wall biosynthesis